MRVFLTGKNARQDLDEGFPTSLEHNLGVNNHTLCSSLDDEPEVVICVDFENSTLPVLKRAKRMNIPRVLIKQEPIVVFPQHRFPNPKGLFDYVITKGKVSEGGLYNYGNTWPKSIEFAEARKRKFVAVTANKWSAIGGELYELRRKVYASDHRVDLFGRGWQATPYQEISQVIKELILASMSGVFPKLPSLSNWRSKPQNYLGAVDNKRTIMASYDYALIIENCTFYNSEKLMDSLLVGNFPVYVGGNLEGLGIPNEFVIQATADCNSVIRAIDEAFEIDLVKFRKNLLDWLVEPSTQENWSANQIWRRILRDIEKQVSYINSLAYSIEKSND
jgi:hypothetical protein